MSLFTWFKREDTKVTLKVDSALNVPQYEFSWDCSDKNYAELLKEQFNKQLVEYKHEIAKDALIHLTNREKSALKRLLKDWDGRNHCWKK